MKRALPWMVLLTAAPSWGAVSPPSGKIQERSGEVVVQVGFGTISFPAGEKARREEKTSPVKKRLACNRGTFALIYELRKNGGTIGVHDLKVSLRNETEYLAAPSLRLQEHEDGHRRLNEAARRDLEAKLKGFETPATTGLKQAEAQLQTAFREELKSLEKLHREWDATNAFVREPPDLSPP